ncbi:MAG: hypothetical protein ACR2JP_07780 [Acidimicrobiia bacterium]
MLLRIRWFILGALSSLVGAAYAASKLRRARQRLTPSALADSGKRAAVAMLDRTADRIDPPRPAAR